MKIEPFPGKLRKRPIVLTRKQVAWLRKWYPEEENKLIVEASGLSLRTLYRLARKLGLNKSSEGLQRIRERSTERLKRSCEENGYYDSLRGRPVSEACLRGVAKMWQDIRDGKREHPLKVIRQQSPEKYSQLSRLRSESRKELIRREQLRVKYGLSRKTALRNVVEVAYTTRQVLHRCNAVKRGYIVMEDCSERGGERYNIYYDAQTKRAPVFEKNLIKDGFCVKPWK